MQKFSICKVLFLLSYYEITNRVLYKSPHTAYMAKYSKKSQQKVEKVMHEYKKGTLKSGRSNKKVTNRKQAIAIGLSEAREAGEKVPRK